MTHDIAIDAAIRGLSLARKVLEGSRSDLDVLSARRASTQDAALAQRLADEARATLAEIRGFIADAPVVVTQVCGRSELDYLASRLMERHP